MCQENVWQLGYFLEGIMPNAHLIDFLDPANLTAIVQF
jgi:hypothetical protein